MKSSYILFLIVSFMACNLMHKNKVETLDTHSPLNFTTPESQGVDSENLIQLIDYVRDEHINLNSIVISRNGNIVLDAHFYPNKKEFIHDVASITKSITSALVGIAIDQGYIENENQSVSDYLTEYAQLFDTAWKKELTIKHLLTMTSGLCQDFGDGERQLGEMRLAENSIQYILEQALVSKPGSEFAYCSCATQLLSAIIEKATGNSMEVFGKMALFDALKINDFIFTKDRSGITNGWGDSYWLSSDLLKLGQLYLQKGKWNDEQIISEEWVKKSSSEQIRLQNSNESYGYKWWIPNELDGLYEGRGRGDQRLVVFPKENLVVIMTGTGFDPDALGGYIISALKSKSPIAENLSAYEQLKEKLSEIQQPTKFESPLINPILAKEINSRSYVFEKNTFGLTHFKLYTEHLKKAKLVLGLDILRSEEYGEREIPLGMNGEYIISNSTRFKTPMAAKAKWLSDKLIEIDYNDFSNNHKYRIKIKFDSLKNAHWEMLDEAGFGEILNLTAKAINE